MLVGQSVEGGCYNSRNGRYDGRGRCKQRRSKLGPTATSYLRLHPVRELLRQEAALSLDWPFIQP